MHTIDEELIKTPKLFRISRRRFVCGSMPMWHCPQMLRWFCTITVWPTWFMRKIFFIFAILCKGFERRENDSMPYILSSGSHEEGMERPGKNVISKYQVCQHYAEEYWLDGCWICNLGMLFWPTAFSENRIGKCTASKELKNNVAACVHSMGIFYVFWGRGFDNECELYAMGFWFQLSNSKLG